MTIVTLSSRGRLVLPKKIRKRLGLRAGAKLKLELAGDKIILEPLAPAWQRWGGAFSGSRMLEEHLAEHEEEVRRGT